MAVPSPFRRDLAARIQRLVAQHTGSDGEVDLATVKALLAGWLVANPDQLSAQQQANAAVDRYMEGRRPPKQGPHQLAMFEPEAYVPIGENRVRLMRQCKREDLLAWGAISTREHAADAAAHAGRMTYINERLQASWQPTDTLEDVERGRFGWTGPSEETT